MSSIDFKTTLSGTFRPAFAESAFVFEIESTLTSRPLILFFMVDASHSMRFYIDEEKTIQRQTIVQSVAQIGVNSSGIIQDGDYISIATFSTDVKNLLESQYVEVNAESRNMLDSIVTTTLKSDGGKTNYGKAFDYILNAYETIKSGLSADSPHLTGPMLIWFLTDGRPWPDDIEGNTSEDIFNYATKTGSVLCNSSPRNFAPAYLIAFTILLYPVHLQRFPEIPHLISSSVGFGFFCNNS